MAIEKEDENKKKGRKGSYPSILSYLLGSFGGIKKGSLEEGRMGEDVVIKRVLESGRSRKEDEEAFEELRRINRERKGEDKRRAERLGKKLIDECRKEKEKISLERVVKMVLEGADLNVLNGEDNFFKQTALMWAAERGHEGVVEMLIKAGAKVDLQDNNGKTALMRAANGNQKRVLKLLIEAGANLDLQDNDGRTALMWATLYDGGHKGVVEMLIEAGANLDLQNNNGETALMYAAVNGAEEILELLIKAGAKVDLQDNDGRTALMWAAWYEHKRVVEMLRKAGANVDPKYVSKDGKSLLMYAANGGLDGLAKELIDKGAKVDLQDNDGSTALMWAAEKGHERIVEMLLKAEADPFIVNNDGKTAYDLAGNEYIRGIIRSYGTVKKMEKGKKVREDEMRDALEFMLRECSKKVGIIVSRMLS
ncbi:MAG: ankyrin repeat domain-containing protein [Candidatus Anstonellales archaeon]